ncbi:MAG: hypothetical protein GF307_10230 [candidate division Zixibacteria bacterium]|nr:hypothetical protein [candidate division Zixibacteria bacterium]
MRTITATLLILVFAFANSGFCAEDTLSVLNLMNDRVVYFNEGQDDGEIDFAWEKPEEIITKGKKSAFKAGLLSFVLPGAGEYYLGRKGRAAFFFGTEAVIWGGFFAFRAYGSWREDDYKNYAATHAGVNPDGKSEGFWEDLQFYESRDWYNVIEGDRFGGAYPESDSYYWKWDSDASRDEYRSIRNSSEKAFRNSSFMLIAAGLNRVISFVDAIRIARSMKKTEGWDIYGGWRLKYDAKPFGRNPSASVQLVKSLN